MVRGVFLKSGSVLPLLMISEHWMGEGTKLSTCWVVITSSSAVAVTNRVKVFALGEGEERVAVLLFWVRVISGSETEKEKLGGVRKSLLVVAVTVIVSKGVTVVWGEIWSCILGSLVWMMVEHEVALPWLSVRKSRAMCWALVLYW